MMALIGPCSRDKCSLSSVTWVSKIETAASLEYLGSDSGIVATAFGFKNGLSRIVSNLNGVSKALPIPWIFVCTVDYSYFIGSDFTKEISETCGVPS